MGIRNVNELTQFLEDYLKDLFSTIDDELILEFFAIKFELTNDLINIRYANNLVGISTSIETLTNLYERRNHLKDLLEINITQTYIDHSILYYSDFFISDNYIFCFAYKFDRKIVDSYYKMAPSTGLKIRSIIDAIILESIRYINQCTVNFINDRDINLRSINDLLKDSGKLLLSAILSDHVVNNPFDKFSKISSLSYEKTFSNGKILLLDPAEIKTISEKKHMKLLLTFEDRIALSSHRHIRKLLELSKKDIYLLSDGEYVYSVIQFNEDISHLEAQTHYFIIEFNTYYSWQLNHNQNKLMQVTNEEVYIPKPKVSYSNFSYEFKKIYPDAENKKIIYIYKLLLEALKQVKGTILVISKNARSEAFRLKNQGFIINPTYLNTSTIKSITSIDGAVLLDLDGYCQGIGVILDGVATDKGDPSRGARYNSAIRYVETIANNELYSDSIAIVISEDGDVNIITKYSF